MRHRKGFNHLGRTSSHRKAMLANMASSLIMHKRIRTTTAKAKALRSYIEPLLTKSKEDTTHSRRVVFSYLKDKNAVSELFREVSPKIAERPGGYTRILKTGNRLGDNAEMCIIELVDFNENMLAATEEAKAKSTRRGRRGRGKKAASETVAEQTTGVAEETAVPEESAPEATAPEGSSETDDTTATPEQEAQPAAEVKDEKAETASEQPEAATDAEAEKAPVTEEKKDDSAGKTAGEKTTDVKDNAETESAKEEEKEKKEDHQDKKEE